MKKLTGKSVGTTLTEFYGPIQGKNFNLPKQAANRPENQARIRIRVLGEGAVKLQYTNEYELVGEGLNPVYYEKRAKNWKDVSWNNTPSGGGSTFADTEIEINENSGDTDFILVEYSGSSLTNDVSTILQENKQEVSSNPHSFPNPFFSAFRVVVAEAAGFEKVTIKSNAVGGDDITVQQPKEGKVLIDAQWS